jgi:hypothetical protein
METLDQGYLMDVGTVGVEGHFLNCSIRSCLKSGYIVLHIRVETPFEPPSRKNIWAAIGFPPLRGDIEGFCSVLT